MSEFKVGDWVTVKGTLAGDKFKLTDKEVEYKEILLAHFSFGEETWSYWKPKVDDWCWYGFELVQVIDVQDDHIKITRQNMPIFEEISQDKLKPFIGELPEITSMQYE